MDEETQERLLQLQAEESRCRSKISGKQTAQYQAQNIFAKLDAEINEATNKQTEYTNLKNSLNTLNSDLGTLSSSLSELITNLHSLGDGNRMDGILDQVGKKLLTVSTKIDNLTSIIGSIDEKLKYYQGQLDYLIPQRDGIKKTIEENEQYIAAKNDELASIQAQIGAIIGSY